MTITSLLEARRDELTATERRLADIIIADPAEAARASVAALATQAGAHGASVVRLAKKLGFSGFPEFRAALHAEAFVVHEPAARLQDRLTRLPQEGLLTELIRQETAAMTQLPELMDDEQMLEAASMIARAKKVLICASGSSVVLGHFMMDRLQRVGRRAQVFDPAGRSAALALASATPDDVLITITLTRIHEVSERSLLYARSIGLPTLHLAEPGLRRTPPIADLTLLVPRGPADAAQTLVVPMLVISGLLLCVSRIGGAKDIAAAERYGSLRRMLSTSKL